MSSLLYRHQFRQLTQILTQFQWLWRPIPMEHTQLPWQNAEPLCQWLATLENTQMAALKAHPDAVIETLATWWPALAQLTDLTTVPIANHVTVNINARLGVGVPGRKWAQIQAYLSAMPKRDSTVRYLEWCAGKGYLGRGITAATGKPVESLEWQAALCEQGQLFAEQKALPMQFHPLDAMSEEAAAVIAGCDHGLALHACGDLHVQLLKKAIATDMQAITVSPCCYQLISGERYQPLSSEAQHASLVLSKADLKLAVQEAVTGGRRVCRQREQEVTYRLGFDEWQRDWQGSDQYLPLPALKKSQLTHGFGEFCRWGAEQKGLILPADFDEAEYHTRGQARFVILEQMNVVKSAFRRAMEYWLVLDRVLFLQQHGYRVTLTQFCDRQLTPRNLLIHAEK
ncbi:methyltransferase [Salinivibrio sp. ES.052]|uniref:methyltransferase n=1 Tax=Salinivibrio sp. ES.052 TaxID=1882823 RepID=UPI00092BD91D|nr:methyltransferase [Salinivibrio sp. ES.052]SIN92838.1 Methyltransferase domain-containing protein [Salinivibrio sp. ES.052]